MSTVQVYVGRWTDWSRGKILGDSITVDVKTGKYILSAAATFISIVGGFAWTIAAYAAHRFLSRKRDVDFIHAQNQISFRNSQSALSTAGDLFCIGWVWSPRRCFCCRRRKGDRKHQRVNRRCLPAVLYPLLIWGIFVILAILSSNIAPPAYRSSDVRVKQSNCRLSSFNISSTDGLTAQQLKVLNDTIVGRQYARVCYSKDFYSKNPTACSLYASPGLAYSGIELSSQCPFGPKQSSENMKLSFKGGECDTLYNTGSHLMFTDMLDSHEHLGINARERDRIRFQKNTTCSPLSVANRTSVYNGPFAAQGTDSGTKVYTAYNFGPFQNGISAYTYLYSPSTVQDIVGYQIDAFTYQYGITGSWSPIPPLVRTDGDTTLILFAANTVYYAIQVLDPFFLALYADQVNVPQFGQSSTTQESYFLPSNKVSAMGCVEQYAMINPNNGKRIGPLSLRDLSLAVEHGLGLNAAQYVTAQRIIYGFRFSDTYTSVFGSGAAALKASDRVLNFKCLGLPFGQWRKEVEGWFETGLAKVQSYAVEYASSSAPSMGNFSSVKFPGANSSTVAAWKDQCGNQKIRNTGGYQTFSFFGIVFTFAVGVAIILSATVGLWFMKWLTPPTSPAAWKYAADSKFQLQRMVLEEGGYGTESWRDRAEDIPWSAQPEVIDELFWKGKIEK